MTSDDKTSGCKVYGLSSTKDGTIRYIGQTALELNRRLNQHLAAGRNPKHQAYVNRWIRKQLRDGYGVEIHLIEDEAEPDLAEIRWIYHYRRFTPNMVNVASGGLGGVKGIKRSDETKAKMRKPKSLEARIRMMKPKAETTRKRMSLAQTGNAKSRGESNRHCKLTESLVRQIKQDLLNGVPGAAIARRHGVQKSAISKINVGRNWSHIAV